MTMLSTMASPLSQFLLRCAEGLTPAEKLEALDLANKAKETGEVRCVEHDTRSAVGDTVLCLFCVRDAILAAPTKQSNNGPAVVAIH